MKFSTLTFGLALATSATAQSTTASTTVITGTASSTLHSSSTSSASTSSTYTPGAPGNAQQTGVSVSQSGSGAAAVVVPPGLAWAALAGALGAVAFAV
ncbi:hypothetical protein Tdes44962_MAKER00292 [Teratosphaeria destructans]|uniref:Uncharacterized protein n=1 Tax=Teratosphaeria destructans TaxID=418781 RepID=A0A9W7SVJ8_9PEZI|nr:hypothetical protein Tdes44962_MAKER00292 [Teratosphaeria destructans]